MKEETPAEQIARGQMMISDGCALRDQGTAIMKSEEEFERGQKMVFAGESMVMLGHAHIRSAEREIHAQRTDLQRAIFREDKGGARKLLSDGADPNEVSDADQNPPLRIAFKNNLLALMRTLLAKGADPNIEANPGLPLLHAILRTHDLRLLASMLKPAQTRMLRVKRGPLWTRSLKLCKSSIALGAHRTITRQTP